MSTFANETGAQTPRDIDGLCAWAHGRPGHRAPKGTVAVVGAGAGLQCKEAFVDRAGAVQLIDALTAAVEAADTREAAETRKLKRGDLVWFRVGFRSLHPSNYQFRYVAVDDEINGRVALVRVASPYPHDQLGAASEHVVTAADYERVPEAR